MRFISITLATLFATLATCLALSATAVELQLVVNAPRGQEDLHKWNALDTDLSATREAGIDGFVEPLSLDGLGQAMKAL